MLKLSKLLTASNKSFNNILLNEYYPYTFYIPLKTDAMRLKVLTWRRTAVCFRYGLKFTKSHPAALFTKSSFPIDKYSSGKELVVSKGTLSSWSVSKVSLFYLNLNLCTERPLTKFSFVQTLHSVYCLRFTSYSRHQRLVVLKRFIHSLIFLQNSKAVCTLNIPQYKN